MVKFEQILVSEIGSRFDGTTSVTDALEMDTDTKFYWRDSAIYAQSPSDGNLKLVADTGIELESALTLDGTVTIDTGHYMACSNDGTSASSQQLKATAAASTQGWIRYDVEGTTGYLAWFTADAIP